MELGRAKDATLVKVKSNMTHSGTRLTVCIVHLVIDVNYNMSTSDDVFERYRN